MIITGRIRKMNRRHTKLIVAATVGATIAIMATPAALDAVEKAKSTGEKLTAIQAGIAAGSLAMSSSHGTSTTLLAQNEKKAPFGDG
jgi:curli biogenesis system outer membrane secretion channel CsgG